MNWRDLIVVTTAAIGVMVLNVLISFGVVWFYSVFIAPGQPASYYEAFAMRVAPISSVVAGIPLMFAAGYSIARSRPGKRGLMLAAAAAVLYILLDTGILISANASGSIWLWAVTSNATKLLSALAGAKLGTTRAAPKELN